MKSLRYYIESLDNERPVRLPLNLKNLNSYLLSNSKFWVVVHYFFGYQVTIKILPLLNKNSIETLKKINSLLKVSYEAKHKIGDYKIGKTLEQCESIINYTIKDNKVYYVMNDNSKIIEDDFETYYASKDNFESLNLDKDNFIKFLKVSLEIHSNLIASKIYKHKSYEFKI